jgi:hypothetical protein
MATNSRKTNNINLVKRAGTATNIIAKYSADISKMYEDETVSTADFKQYILNIFKTEVKDTPATKKMVARIQKINNKTDLTFCVYNIFSAGTGNAVLD